MIKNSLNNMCADGLMVKSLAFEARMGFKSGFERPKMAVGGHIRAFQLATGFPGISEGSKNNLSKAF